MKVINLLNGFILILILYGCAAQRSYKDGLSLLDSGKSEEGLAQLGNAYKLDSDNSEYKSQYFKRRDAVVYQWLSQAETAKKNALWDDVESYYRRILMVDTENVRAKIGIRSLNTEKNQAQLLIDAKLLLEANDITAASNKVRLILADSPSQPLALEIKRQIENKIASSKQASVIVKSKLARPITIEFKDSPISSVLGSISKISGINFVIDKDVRQDLRSNFFVRDASLEDVIRFILVANQLEQRILNANTLFIYPSTPSKLKDFQELQIKNFYLTNASAKSVAALLKGMIKTKDIYVEEKLNLIVMRDTPEAIRVAERLVAAQDIAEPEVMLEVEVLEVGSNVLDNIGIQYPSQVSLSMVGKAGVAGSATLNEIRNSVSRDELARVTLSDPAFIVNMLHQDGDTNLLANPRIRAKNHEKASIHIGDKLPVISNTTTSTGFVSQSITYLDVGLKLEVEPTVYLDNDVGIKVGMEVSSISKQIQNTNGSLTYQIGTRNASTVLRLKDGETQILAGLINKEDRKSANSVPILGQIPLLGRLFSSHSDSTSKTEVVLLITPRIVRNIVRPESPIEQFPSGTEASIGLERLEIKRADNAKENMVAEPKLAHIAATEPIAKQTDLAALAAMPSMAVSATPSAQATALLGNIKLTLEATAQVQSDKLFTVKVNLVAEGLQSALVGMSFDPAKLKVVSITEGELLKRSDGKTQFFQQIQEKTGRLNFSVIRQGNVQGEGALASITFQSLEALGSTQLRVGAVSFTDATGRVLPVNILPVATVEIVK